MNPRSRLRLTWTVSLLLVTAVGTLPAYWNGSAFLFYDSVWYFHTLVKGYVDINRPTLYARFMDLLPGRSPMVWVWFQAFLQSVVLHHLWRRTEIPPGYRSALSLSALTLLTPLGFLTSLLMPDFSGGLLVLLVGLTLVFWDRSSKTIRGVNLGLILLFLTFHLSHLSIMVALLAGWVVGRRLFSGQFPKKEPVIALCLCLLVAVGALGLSSRLRWNSWDPSPHASLYLFARYYSAGPVRAYLVQKEKEQNNDLWPPLFELLDEYPAGCRPQALLWEGDSPVNAYGGLTKQNQAAKRVVREVVFWAPGWMVVSFFRCGLEQVGSITLSDALVEGVRIPEIMGDMYPTAFKPGEKVRFDRARQQQEAIPYRLWDALNYSIYLGGVLLLLLVMVVRRARRDRWWCLSAFALYGVSANGVLCGGLSALDGRYQLRVSWLPLVVGILWILRERNSRTEFRLRQEGACDPQTGEGGAEPSN